MAVISINETKQKYGGVYIVTHFFDVHQFSIVIRFDFHIFILSIIVEIKNWGSVLKNQMST